MKAGSQGETPRPSLERASAGNLDRVGAHDRDGVELEPRDRHLQAAQRDDHLDLAGVDVETLLDLVDRGVEAVGLEREV